MITFMFAQGFSPAIGFTATGDFIRDGNLEAIANLLNRGVKVALMYGDRDYQCNCKSTRSFTLLFGPLKLF